jgi:hypothetical protein
MYAVDRQRADVDKAPYAALGGCVYEVARTFDVGAALAINMTTEQRSTVKDHAAAVRRLTQRRRIGQVALHNTDAIFGA